MARVIKSDQSSRVSGVGKLAALNVANFAAQAEKLVREAREQAQTILDDARAEARRIEREAAEKTADAERQGYDAGYREGRAQGEADGKADGAEKAFEQAMELFRSQSQDLQQALRGLIEGVDAARGEILRQARADLLDLAIAVADKVSRSRAENDIETARANLAKAIELAGCASQLDAHVCPAQLDELQELAGALFEELRGSETVRLVADDTLSPGDVVVRSRRGEVDARLQTQIDNVVAALRGEGAEVA